MQARRAPSHGRLSLAELPFAQARVQLAAALAGAGVAGAAGAAGAAVGGAGGGAGALGAGVSPLGELAAAAQRWLDLTSRLAA